MRFYIKIQLAWLRIYVVLCSASRQWLWKCLKRCRFLPHCTTPL